MTMKKFNEENSEVTDREIIDIREITIADMLVSKLVRTDNVGAGDGFGTKILDRQSEKF